MVIWLSIFVIYFIFFTLISGLNRWKKDLSSSTVTPPVTVVVAMRNEAHNLRMLIPSLAQQTYAGKWELILVDDHSEDTSVQVAQALQHEYPQFTFTLIKSAGNGKKQALAMGINAADGEIIVTTDADCELPPDWLADLVRSFKPTTQLVAGTVCLKNDATLFGNLQAVEFASVMAMGLGMLGWHKPVMCNGASLAFRKSAFDAVGGYTGNEHIASGDDEFLMRKISVQFPKSIRAIIYGNNSCKTIPPRSIGDFLSSAFGGQVNGKLILQRLQNHWQYLFSCFNYYGCQCSVWLFLRLILFYWLACYGS
ncbi:MAG: family 2 glycosyl transferase [Bacteroidetes bacterium OLB12]|nr:MAG: family 2 glycosyl transferase [Bacteroidetes bacterium OLB12]